MALPSQRAALRTGMTTEIRGVIKVLPVIVRTKDSISNNVRNALSSQQHIIFLGSLFAFVRGTRRRFWGTEPPARMMISRGDLAGTLEHIVLDILRLDRKSNLSPVSR